MAVSTTSPPPSPSPASTGDSSSDTNTTPVQATAAPTISLSYKSGTGKTAVAVTLVSKAVSYTTDTSAFVTPGLDPADQAKERFELTPGGIQQLTEIFSGLDVAGTLRPGCLSMTFRIPVGFQTGTLQIIVSGLESQSMPVRPALDQLYLVSSTGKVLAALLGASALPPAPPQGMTVSLSAVPVGAQLLARVVESPLKTAPATGTSSFSASQIVPFTLEVRRSNLSTGTTLPAQMSSSSASAFSTGPLSSFLDTFSTTSFTATASSSIAAELVTPTAGNTAVPQTADETVETTEASEFTVPLSTAAPGVWMGPLVSRGSSPLGPTLGTIQREPTPSVDRAERAFDLAMNGSDAGANPELLPGRVARGHDGAGFEGGGDDPGSVSDRSSLLVAIRNPGGLPILTGAMKIEPSGVDRAAILASLAGETEALGAESQTEQPAESRFQVIQPDPDRSDGAVCADFFTMACGLLLGIGLTSGPLYPDLISFVHHWLPRRMRRAIRSRADAQRLKRLP